MELLYQDSQIVLCVKPAGLSSEAGAGSLPELLEDQLGRPVFPVHRLDRNVGGVMVYMNCSLICISTAMSSFLTS